MKRCLDCGGLKSLEAFYRRRSEPDGRAQRCLECGSRKAKADNARRAERKRVDPAYAERVKSYSRNYRRKIKDEVYGLGDGGYEALLAAQNGRCAACGRTPEEVGVVGRSGEVLHVDHDHSCCPGVTSCGQCVRGLLCKKCNSALGLLDDDVDRLVALAEYVTQARLRVAS